MSEKITVIKAPRAKWFTEVEAERDGYRKAIDKLLALCSEAAHYHSISVSTVEKICKEAIQDEEKDCTCIECWAKEKAEHD